MDAYSTYTVTAMPAIFAILLYAMVLVVLAVFIFWEVKRQRRRSRGTLIVGGVEVGRSARDPW